MMQAMVVVVQHCPEDERKIVAVVLASAAFKLLIDAGETEEAMRAELNQVVSAAFVMHNSESVVAPGGSA